MLLLSLRKSIQGRNRQHDCLFTFILPTMLSLLCIIKITFLYNVISVIYTNHKPNLSQFQFLSRFCFLFSWPNDIPCAFTFSFLFCFPCFVRAIYLLAFRAHPGHRQFRYGVNGCLVHSTREHGGDQCGRWQIQPDISP